MVWGLETNEASFLKLSAAKFLFKGFGARGRQTLASPTRSIPGRLRSGSTTDHASAGKRRSLTPRCNPRLLTVCATLLTRPGVYVNSPCSTYQCYHPIFLS